MRQIVYYCMAFILLSGCVTEDAEEAAVEAPEQVELSRISFPLAGLQSSGETWQGEYNNNHPEPLEIMTDNSVTVDVVLINSGALGDCSPDNPNCCPRFETIEHEILDNSIRFTGRARVHNAVPPCPAIFSFESHAVNLGILEPGTWQIIDTSNPEFSQELIVRAPTH